MKWRSSSRTVNDPVEPTNELNKEGKVEVNIGVRQVENGYIIKMSDSYDEGNSFKEWIASDVNEVCKMIRTRLERH